VLTEALVCGAAYVLVDFPRPIEFDVPNRVGATIHLSGRSANVNDRECAYELSPLTRWRIGGSTTSLDSDRPGPPVFAVQPGW